MPLFGAHMSAAGGCHNAAAAARAHGCGALQLFTKNANQWEAGELTDEAVRQFRAALRGSGVKRTLAHDSYLINLASPDPALYRRSIEAFLVELQRAERLGLHYLVTHPGAHMSDGEEAGLQRVATAIDEVHARTPNAKVQILLETTAGQGTSLGYKFEHLARILELTREADRLGVCLDSCHVFAAGYALAPAAEYAATMKAFDKCIGWRRLKAFHLNDSLKKFGSRVDRHAHLGRGCLGLEPFRLIVNDVRWRTRPMILETPKEDGDDKTMDAVNLAILRGLVEQES